MHSPEILVVDDDPTNRKLLTDLVGREGYTARSAAGGREALELIETQRVDLVLLDLMMPEVDGMMVLAELQRRGHLPALPVVVVTALDARESRIEALRAGAIDFIAKPIDRTELRCKMRSLVELKRLRDAAATDAAGARAELRAVLESAPDLIMSLDREGIIRYANRATPPHSATLLAGSAWATLASTPEGRAERAAAVERVLATGEPVHLACTEPGDVGELRHLECHLGAVRLAAEISGVVIVARDATEQKRTEMQLAISERMASVGTLAAGVAHEINNPLAVVLANLEIAMRDTEAHAVATESPAAEELRAGLRHASEAGERIRQIVRDLKLFSRAEDAERLAAVDVNRVLQSTARMASTELRHRARLVLDYGETPPVRATESRLGQVFLNLLLNAAQAIPEGDAEHNEVRVTTSVDGAGRVQVEIRDSGVGISRETLGRLFTPFFTTKPVGVGTGLGLSICQRIVTALGGEIYVDSAVGAGSTFRVLLPSARQDDLEAQVIAPTPSDAPPTTARTRGRILVVDDEPMVAQSLRRALAKQHDVTTADSARAALDLLLLPGCAFDMIVCDLMMPQMTGMDLYDAVKRARGPEWAARFVFLTGGAFTQRARQFLDAVPNLRLEKPFDTGQLRAIVNDRIR